MPERHDNVLDYARKPSGWRNLVALSRRGVILTGVLAVLLALGYGYFHGPTSGQIRLDTGDLRYCWYGIPLEYHPMAEPERSKLLALAAKSPTRPSIPAKWVTCTTDPSSTEHRPHVMFREMYFSVAIWTDEDRQIARWAMDDLVDYVLHAKWGLPKSRLLLNGEVVDWRTCKVTADWRDRDEVKWYCADHGYIPPAPARTPTK